MSNHQPLIIGGAIALVLVAGWTGASYATQHAIEARIRTATDIQDPQVPVRFANLQQHVGIRHSSGEVDILTHLQCSGANVPDTTIGHLHYEIEPGFNPFGAQHVHWTLEVAPKDPVAPSASTLPRAPETVVLMTLTGDGSMDRHGSSEQRIAFALNEKLVPRDKLRIDPMDVSVHVDGAGGSGSFLLPSVHLVDPKGEAAEIRNLSGKFETPDGRAYNGTYLFGLDDIVSRDFSVHGLRVEGRSKVDHDVLGAHGSYRVASGRVDGKDLKDLVLEVSLDGLALADIDRVRRATDARCASEATDGAIDSKAAQEALSHLVHHGFKVAVDRLAGTVGDGSIDGSARVEILGTPANEAISTSRVLKASGRLRVSGRDLMPASIEPLVQQHLVVADGDGMKAEFELSDGKLTLNGNPLDLPFLQLIQARADAALAGAPADGAAIGPSGGPPSGAAGLPGQ